MQRLLFTLCAAAAAGAPPRPPPLPAPALPPPAVYTDIGFVIPKSGESWDGTFVNMKVCPFGEDENPDPNFSPYMQNWATNRNSEAGQGIFNGAIGSFGLSTRSTSRSLSSATSSPDARRREYGLQSVGVP